MLPAAWVLDARQLVETMAQNQSQSILTPVHQSSFKCGAPDAVQVEEANSKAAE